ncbi:hypothetical protein [Bartonella saheliensis]|uniref:hypothetical protein n=1 Tax=Bartonella saheliensis TaxID=1457016 RepID=UPI001FEA1C25|nr:hypothetical protein [Bartonella saheliensis]
MLKKYIVKDRLHEIVLVLNLNIAEQKWRKNSIFMYLAQKDYALTEGRIALACRDREHLLLHMNW